MVKFSSLLVINTLVFILILIQFISGLIIWYGFEEASFPFAELVEHLHPINGFLLAIFIILHLYMNRRWIRAQFMPK